ncbi:MAG: hypothetical protein RIQ38_1313, partial [Pseudomonadota bacterium]
FQNLLQLPGRVYQVNRDPSQNRDSYLLNYSESTYDFVMWQQHAYVRLFAN